ncbi:MAG TPA: MBL fold metallo-hydrolase [Thermoanaerobaculia bacterium]|nr:MBL fold metallo-hydrolase [Thermoanaerobaculia bacterium]
MVGRLTETRLGDQVRVWSLGGERLETSYGANCTAVAGGDAVLLVDPLIAPTHARLVESAVRAWTDRPVRFVLLTHHHTDHALGAAWFACLGATVVAHRAGAAAMEREHAGLIESRRKIPALAELFGDAEPHVPSLLLDENEWSVDLGGTTVRARHPGPGHTPGDLVVSIDDAAVTVCGDLVSVGYHVNYEDAALDRLAAGLDELRARDTPTYVPGHGAVGGPEILETQRGYHLAVRDAAAEKDVEQGIAELRRRYPGYRLEELLPQSIAFWRNRGES